ncbi:MAG: transglutaminase-like domain-containing protein, partial [Pseudoclavibacter sp.]|nr:transglutaminase-like domain-containing protein [Pseudoclavibacter sp.]
GVPRAALFALLALLWLGRPRGGNAAVSRAARRGLRRHRLGGAAAIAATSLLAAGGAGLLAQPAVDAGRFVLREAVTPPLRPLETDSPLAAFRSYTKGLHDTVLFHADGLRQGDLIRLATLDAYDGRHWTIMDPELGVEAAGTYNLVGEQVPQRALLTSSAQRTVHVRIDGYRDVWMPTVGAPTRISLEQGPVLQRRADLRFNGQTGTGLVTTGLGEGDAYTVAADLQDVPLEGQLDNTPVADLQMPVGPPPPAALVERMQTFIQGETSSYLQLRAIEQAFVSQGYLSHGSASDMAPSRAGHGLDRMQELFDLSYMVGDSEQYASAMALMAQQLGYPVRVVMGFAPSGDADGGPVPVTGADVTAWVEVPFEGFGWVAFHPTPDRTDVPINTSTEPQTKPKAQVRQPPQSDERPDELITAAETPDDDQRPGPPFQLPLWARILLLGVVLPLAIVALLLGALELARRRRRRLRRSTGPPDERVVGAWDEAIDRLAELGRPVPARQTRRAAAGIVEPGLLPVAIAADRAVFSGETVAEAEIERVWAEAEAVVAAADRQAEPWRRLLARCRYRLEPLRRAAGRVLRGWAERFGRGGPDRE